MSPRARGELALRYLTIAELPPASAPTRPRASGTEPQFIDHVIVRGTTARDTTVVAVDGLSDHNFVRATITG
ncbi:hypothetical protein ACQP2U_33910 [Nocardia sp. CA-084685]|uniref:hypothetical protein n=1 Tax=Nocardia sp. CA-084685 TaxID=3239970 RepID=UPI003D95674A